MALVLKIAHVLVDVGCPVLDFFGFHLDAVPMEANARWEQLTWGTQEVTGSSPLRSSISERAPICLQNQLDWDTVREPTDGYCSAGSHRESVLSVAEQCRGRKGWRKRSTPV